MLLQISQRPPATALPPNSRRYRERRTPVLPYPHPGTRHPPLYATRTISTNPICQNIHPCASMCELQCACLTPASPASQIVAIATTIVVIDRKNTKTQGADARDIPATAAPLVDNIDRGRSGETPKNLARLQSIAVSRLNRLHCRYGSKVRHFAGASDVRVSSSQSTTPVSH